MLNPNFQRLNEVLRQMAAQGPVENYNPPFLPMQQPEDGPMGDITDPVTTSPGGMAVAKLKALLDQKRAAANVPMPTPKRMKFGGGDIPALGVLLLSLFGGKGGQDFASGFLPGYMGGKQNRVDQDNQFQQMDWQNRTHQAQVGAQNAEQDYQGALADQRYGDQVSREDQRYKAQTAQHLAERQDDIEREGNTNKANILRSIINDTSPPKSIAEIPNYFRTRRTAIKALGSIKGNEDILNLMPPDTAEEDYKREMLTGAKAKNDESAAKEAMQNAAKYEALANAATDHHLAAMWFGMAAGVLPKDSAEQKAMLEAAKYAGSNPTYREQGDDRANQVKAVDEEIQGYDKDIADLQQRAGRGPLSAEEQAAWNKIKRLRQDAVDWKKQLLTGKGVVPVTDGLNPGSPSGQSSGLTGDVNSLGRDRGVTLTPPPGKSAKPAKTEADKAKDAEWKTAQTNAVNLKAKIAGGNFTTIDDPDGVAGKEAAQKQLDFWLGRMDEIKPGSSGREPSWWQRSMKKSHPAVKTEMPRPDKQAKVEVLKQQANDAITKGANKAEVMKRLAEQIRALGGK